MSSSSLYIGLMSGTSVDGVDACLVNIDHDKIELIDFITHPMHADLQTHLKELNISPKTHLEQLCQLEHQVAQAFIQATEVLLEKTGNQPDHIQAIGSHGQTIYHATHIPMSLQIGHSAFIAKQTGIQTIGDFRVDDMALGGQGAPLAPAFHKQLFKQQKNQVLANIGGIANISWLPRETSNKEAIIGYDTGPGNALMDEWCEKHFDCTYDKNGQLAKAAKPNAKLLKSLLEDNYFQKAAPKSTGREYFNQVWLEAKLSELDEKLSAECVLSTLNQLTVETLAQEIERLPSLAEEVLICGGGALNHTLIERLQIRLPNSSVATTEKYQVNAHAIEAMMCAWLAERRLKQQPIDLCQITGAKDNAILGAIWLP